MTTKSPSTLSFPQMLNKGKCGLKYHKNRRNFFVLFSNFINSLKRNETPGYQKRWVYYVICNVCVHFFFELYYEIGNGMP